MPKSKIILIGAGGHANSCIEVLEGSKCYEIAGLIGHADEVGEMRLGYPIIGTDADLGEIVKSCPNALIALGQIKSPKQRMAIYELATKLGYKLPVIKSTTAQISAHAVIGDGTVVMHGVIINAGATIGSNCIINTKALIEHGAQVGDHVHISTGAIINGDCNVGCGSFIGSGSVVQQNISIGKNCLIGMGAAVKEDVMDNEKVLR